MSRSSAAWLAEDAQLLTYASPSPYGSCSDETIGYHKIKIIHVVRFPTPPREAPAFVRQHKILLAAFATVQDIIDSLLAKQIIRECNSAPVWPVLKSMGKWHLTMDYRQLNKLVVSLANDTAQPGVAKGGKRHTSPLSTWRMVSGLCQSTLVTNTSWLSLSQTSSSCSIVVCSGM